MSDWMTAAGVKYVTKNVSMTPAGVKYVSMQDSCKSQVSQCMTPAGVKYLHA